MMFCSHPEFWKEVWKQAHGVLCGGAISSKEPRDSDLLFFLFKSSYGENPTGLSTSWLVFSHQPATPLPDCLSNSKFDLDPPNLRPFCAFQRGVSKPFWACAPIYVFIYKLYTGTVDGWYTKIDLKSVRLMISFLIFSSHAPSGLFYSRHSGTSGPLVPCQSSEAWLTCILWRSGPGWGLGFRSKEPSGEVVVSDLHSTCMYFSLSSEAYKIILEFLFLTFRTF